MPTLELYSLECVKRDDDGLNAKDEPYLLIDSDEGPSLTIYPIDAKGNTDIGKGDRRTAFKKLSPGGVGRNDLGPIKANDLHFADAISISLRESDDSKLGIHSKDETIGTFTVRASEAGSGSHSRTLTSGKNGNDAKYIVKYGVTADPVREVPVPDPTWQLKLSSVKRWDNARPTAQREPMTVRVLANGGVILEAELRQGAEALRRDVTVDVESPLTLRIDEVDHLGRASTVASWTGSWSSQAPNLPAMPMRKVTDDGEVLTMIFSVEERRSVVSA